MKILTILIAMLMAIGALADDTTGSVVEQDLMKGLAEIDFLVETGNQNSSIAIGSNNSSLVWGWCDDLGTKDEAKKCALSKCPEDSCKIFTVNGEQVNINSLQEFLIGRDLHSDIISVKQDDYEKRKDELYSEMSSTHWSDGLAKGMVQGLILVPIIFFIYRRAKKRNSNSD